jgi:hypothetical protein
MAILAMQLNVIGLAKGLVLNKIERHARVQPWLASRLRMVR